MTRKMLALWFAFAVGAVVGHVATPSGTPLIGVAMAQSHKPVFMTRLFTGPDNLTHSEEVPIDFPGGSRNCCPSLRVNSI